MGVVANIKGATGANGATWLHGSGVPDDGDGANDDFYLDDATQDLYVKAAGTWGAAVTNIKGEAGADAAAGPADIFSVSAYVTIASFGWGDLASLDLATDVGPATLFADSFELDYTLNFSAEQQAAGVRVYLDWADSGPDDGIYIWQPGELFVRAPDLDVGAVVKNGSLLVAEYSQNTYPGIDALAGVQHVWVLSPYSAVSGPANQCIIGTNWLGTVPLSRWAKLTSNEVKPNHLLTGGTAGQHPVTDGAGAWTWGDALVLHGDLENVGDLADAVDAAADFAAFKTAFVNWLTTGSPS